MTPTQNKQCHAIIHPAALAAAAGNAVPVPGLGVAVDTATLVTMTLGLSAVFSANLTKEAAKAIAISAIKNTMLRAPLRVIAKELSKLIPGLGQVVAPTVSAALLEAAGWTIANELDREQQERERGSKRS